MIKKRECDCENCILGWEERGLENRAIYEEVQASYRDTGYDRYFNKMNKLDAEYEELKAFLHQEEKIVVQPETIIELNDLKQKLRCMKSKWEYLRHDLPVSAEVIGIDDIFRDIRL